MPHLKDITKILKKLNDIEIEIANIADPIHESIFGPEEDDDETVGTQPVDKDEEEDLEVPDQEKFSLKRSRSGMYKNKN